jgi:hypothetical protein
MEGSNTAPPVNADANGDGRVSMIEAFNYARSMDQSEETPWYEDRGDGIPHNGAMPSQGEGALGSNAYLELRGRAFVGAMVR